MKKITLFIPDLKDGQILIVLGNGYKFEFTQKKKAEKFIVDTSKFLTVPPLFHRGQKRMIQFRTLIRIIGFKTFLLQRLSIISINKITTNILF